MNGLEQFIASVILLATPMVFAALGACWSERGGIINLGMEGYMITGAWAAAVAQSHSPSVAMSFIFACGAGALLGAIFGLFVVFLKSPVIITGFAISLLGLAFTAHYGRTLVGKPINAVAQVPIPLLSDIPVLGRAVFSQPLTFALLLALTFASMYVLQRTSVGLKVRAIGESPALARRYGIPVGMIQLGLCCATGAVAGIGGGHLLMCVTAVWTEKMTAGQGWVALALVVLARWRPYGILIAGYCFGAVLAAQFFFQAIGWRISSQLLAALPYAAALLAAMFDRSRSGMPSSLRNSA